MRGAKGRFDFVQEFLTLVFADDLHAKRVLSLANGPLGVMTGAALAVSLIGQALAQARRLVSKSAIKQVDRLSSNAGVVPWDLFGPWVGEVVGVRREIVVAMDWTDFDADNQSTLALHLVTRHGRATPLLWLTVDKDELKGQRNDFEDLCLSRLKALLPDGVTATILADRGFGDVKLFEFLESLGFRYVIRFRGDIRVSAADGETRLAADWVGKGGRARKLRDAEVSAARQKVGAVVCVKAAGMKEAWHLAASDGSLSAPQVITLYSKRWTRDQDHPRQSLGPRLQGNQGVARRAARRALHLRLRRLDRIGERVTVLEQRRHEFVHESRWRIGGVELFSGRRRTRGNGVFPRRWRGPRRSKGRCRPGGSCRDDGFTCRNLPMRNPAAGRTPPTGSRKR